MKQNGSRKGKNGSSMSFETTASGRARSMAVVSSAPAIIAIAAALAAASLPAEGSPKSLGYAAAATAAATASAFTIVIISSALACSSFPLLCLILLMFVLQFMSGISTGNSRGDRHKRIAMTKLVASP